MQLQILLVGLLQLCRRWIYPCTSYLESSQNWKRCLGLCFRYLLWFLLSFMVKRVFYGMAVSLWNKYLFFLAIPQDILVKMSSMKIVFCYCTSCEVNSNKNTYPSSLQASIQCSWCLIPPLRRCFWPLKVCYRARGRRARRLLSMKIVSKPWVNWYFKFQMRFIQAEKYVILYIQ